MLIGIETRLPIVIWVCTCKCTVYQQEHAQEREANQKELNESIAVCAHTCIGEEATQRGVIWVYSSLSPKEDDDDELLFVPDIADMSS